MAQTARNAQVRDRSSRLRLPKAKRFYTAIGDGVTLVYRRTEKGYGTWTAKLAVAEDKYQMHVLGEADDYQDANGVDILSFQQAHRKAGALADTAKANAGVIIRPQSVHEAATEYLQWYQQHRKAYRETEHSVRVHLLPALGDILLDDLTSAQIQRWLEGLATTPARVRTSKRASKQKHRPTPKTAEQKRARKATANRVFNVLKAILNRAFQNGRVVSDAAWRRVKPFSRVDEARIRFLSEAEAVRLVKSCPSDLGNLVRGALMTGARFGELTALRVSDVHLDGSAPRIYIGSSKSGRPRNIPLNGEAVNAFRDTTAGKRSDAFVFTKKNDAPWGKNHHVRGLLAACEAAEITPPVAFHELRHTYASHLAQAGVDLLTISKLLGHADTRITSKHYAHLSDRTLADAVTKLPNLGYEPDAHSEAAS